MNTIAKYDLDRYEIYEIIKTELLKYKIDLQSKTYGIEKIDISKIINIEEILDLILSDERKGIRILPYLDLENIDFKNQDITHIDFTDINATLNPQTVKNKDFSYTVLNGLDFNNCEWDNVRLCFTNFAGAQNVSFNPQKIMYPSLYGSICAGVNFEEELKGVGLQKTDLRKATGVIIHEKELDKSTLFDEKAIIIKESKNETEQQLRQAVLKKILNHIPRCI